MSRLDILIDELTKNTKSRNKSKAIVIGYIIVVVLVGIVLIYKTTIWTLDFITYNHNLSQIETAQHYIDNGYGGNDMILYRDKLILENAEINAK